MSLNTTPSDHKDNQQYCRQTNSFFMYFLCIYQIRLCNIEITSTYFSFTGGHVKVPGHNYVSLLCSAVFVQIKDEMQHVIKSLRPLIVIPALVSNASKIRWLHWSVKIAQFKQHTKFSHLEILKSASSFDGKTYLSWNRKCKRVNQVTGIFQQLLVINDLT